VPHFFSGRKEAKDFNVKHAIYNGMFRVMVDVVSSCNSQRFSLGCPFFFPKERVQQMNPHKTALTLRQPEDIIGL
jgi:hypothetical protein